MKKCLPHPQQYKNTLIISLKVLIKACLFAATASRCLISELHEETGFSRCHGRQTRAIKSVNGGLSDGTSKVSRGACARSFPPCKAPLKGVIGRKTRPALMIQVDAVNFGWRSSPVTPGISGMCGTGGDRGRGQTTQVYFRTLPLSDFSLICHRGAVSVAPTATDITGRLKSLSLQRQPR